jgi:hypothetical protein
VGSKSAPVVIPAGTAVPNSSIVYACTAIGQTIHAHEDWIMAAKLPVECVGIAGFAGTIYPRIAGIVRFRRRDAEQDTLNFAHGNVLSPAGAGPKVICQLVNDRARVWGGGVARSAAERTSIEARRRAASVTLTQPNLGRAVVRDQLPMDDSGLSRCLQDGLTPEEWYRVLNRKVFFWLTRDRLVRLLNAGTYRAQEHDVLELDAKALVNAYADKIWLCPMNSGCTKPMPHPRGQATFQRIAAYPYADWKAKRRRGERVVELAIDYAVPDVGKFVSRACQMRGPEELSALLPS